MASLKQAIDAIVTRMKAVEGCGPNVYDYEISITDPGAFEEYAVEGAKQRINVWTVLIETTQSADKGVAAINDLHQVVIRGFRSVSDGGKSGSVFRDDVEAVRSAFNEGDRKLGGACLNSGPMSRRYQTSGMLGGVLVHYVELMYPVRLYPAS